MANVQYVEKKKTDSKLSNGKICNLLANKEMLVQTSVYQRSK